MFMARPELPYCTTSELASFKRGRESGRVTFFRAAFCERCKCEIPKNKKWCSKKHMEESGRDARNDTEDAEG
jgi:hypothetical protein